MSRRRTGVRYRAKNRVAFGAWAAHLSAATTNASNANSAVRLALFMAIVVIAGCRDNAPITLPIAPPTSATPIIEPPADGTPTYYSYNTTLTSMGSLPGWDEPQRAVSRSFQQQYQWYALGYWRAEMDFGSAYAIAVGYQPAPAYDMASAVKARNVITAYSRTGVQMQGPPPALDLVPANGASYSRIGNATTPAIGDGSAPSVISAIDERAHRADQLVVTKNGSLRTLALLRKQFGVESLSPAGRFLFHKTAGTQTTIVTFDPTLSVVTSLETMESGIKRSETRRIYGRQTGVVVLTAVEHTLFDETGKPSAHFRRDLSDITLR